MLGSTGALQEGLSPPWGHRARFLAMAGGVRGHHSGLGPCTAPPKVAARCSQSFRNLRGSPEPAGNHCSGPTHGEAPPPQLTQLWAPGALRLFATCRAPLGCSCGAGSGEGSWQCMWLPLLGAGALGFLLWEGKTLHLSPKPGREAEERNGTGESVGRSEIKTNEARVRTQWVACLPCS